MSHKHLSLLRSIFQDPLPANLHWREVESLLNHLGASIEPSHGARFKISLNGVTEFIHHPHHGTTCSRELVKQVREFIAHAGISPSTYETEKNE